MYLLNCYLIVSIILDFLLSCQVPIYQDKFLVKCTVLGNKRDSDSDFDKRNASMLEMFFFLSFQINK